MWYGEEEGAPLPDTQLPDTLQDALLACRVETKGCFDPPIGGNCAPDLELTLRSPHAAPIVFFAGPSRHSGRIATPLLRISRGETLTVSARDLDVIGSDAIGQLTLRYEGHAWLRGRSGAVTVTCRVSTHTEIEPWIRRALTKFDEALGKMDLSIDSTQIDLSLRRSDIFVRREEACAMAAVVGWEEPRLARRLAALERQTAIWQSSLARVLDQPAFAPGTAANLHDGISVRVHNMTCSVRNARTPNAERSCVVTLAVTAKAPITLNQQRGSLPYNIGQHRVDAFSNEGLSMTPRFASWYFEGAPKKSLDRQKEIELTSERTLMLVLPYEMKLDEALLRSLQPAWIRVGPAVLRLP